ncbi:MAG: polyprenyl synthetase family protein [Buchnera aphidicola (Schlechtendalia peitan)]
MDFLRFVNSKQKRINNFMLNLLEALPFQNTLLLDAMKYGVLSGGKRIRPILMYSLGEMFQIHVNIIDNLAASIEFMHAYSLIHDDLPSLDNDELRRGQDSCYKKFGESTAILAGNSLQCLAFNVLSRINTFQISNSNKIKMILELSNASGILGMCMGQFLDLQSKNKTITIRELEEIYWYKTGSLIDVSVRLVLISYCKNNDTIFSILSQYFKNISFAFQIKDDILDFKNDYNRMNDFKKLNISYQANTFPLIVGLKQSETKIKELYEKSLECLKILSNESIDIRLLKEFSHYIIIGNK